MGIMSDWRTRAACRDEDPEIFFPDPSDTDTRAQAEAICAKCPVRTECGLNADRFGIWGGTYYEPEHGDKPRGRRPRPREHGTWRGYNQHVNRNEPVCDPCRDAARAQWNRRNAERRTPQEAVAANA